MKKKSNLRAPGGTLKTLCEPIAKRKIDCVYKLKLPNCLIPIQCGLGVLYSTGHHMVPVHPYATGVAMYQKITQLLKFYLQDLQPGIGVLLIFFVFLFVFFNQNQCSS